MAGGIVEAARAWAAGIPTRAAALWERASNSPIALSLLAAALIEPAIGLALGVRIDIGRSLFWQVATPGLIALVVRLSGKLDVLADIAEAWFTWTILAIVGAPLTYLAARAEFPLADAWLRAADLAIGIDVLDWVRFAQARPWLYDLLGHAYNSLGLQIIFCCLLFPLTREMWRFRELFWICWIGLILTCLISAVLPAEGITARYANYLPAWREHLLQLRTDRPVIADIGGMRGIVFFPSFHTVLAIAYSYANRGQGIVSWVLYALNGVMILSTFTHGDHYLVDVIAGAVLAGGLILAMRQFAGGVAGELSGELSARRRARRTAR